MSQKDTLERGLKTALFRVGAVAKAADVTRPTIYAWIDSGVISNTYNVGGTPVFTSKEMQEVKRIAQERQNTLNSLRLSVSSLKPA